MVVRSRISEEADPEAAALVARLRSAGCVFAEEEAEILLEAAGKDRVRLERLASGRVAGAPLEPLVGWVGFGGLRLAIEPGVFVPRQRTLRLADEAVREVRRRFEERGRQVVFLEAFAGVAPLASTVAARVPPARVIACELDPRARAQARRNLGADGETHSADVLRGLPEELRGAVDVIAAVPPYVPAAELGLLPREAREHEPESALDGGPDGLRYARALIEQSAVWLTRDGVLLIELHRSQAAEAARCARSAGLLAEQPRSAPDDEEGQTVVAVFHRAR